MNKDMPMGYRPQFNQQNDYNGIYNKLNMLERKINKLENKINMLEKNIMPYNIPSYPNNYLI